MTMMELILLLAVLVLFGLHLSLAARVRSLEAQLRDDEAELVAEPAVQPSSAPNAPVARPERAASPAQLAKPFTYDRVEAALADEAAPAAATPVSLAALFERLVGGRLLIWIGGIALAIAGIFMIRFSAGLITPPVRMVIAGLFGLLLLGGGEWARSRPGALPDPRVPQALVGAGILVLYAAPYGALILYQLISIGTASTLMVIVTAAALALSLRHGSPTAVMGLAGGFATPLLVGDPNAGAVPLLFYLALLDIALFALAARRGWTWLAASAVLLSLVWTAALLGAPAKDALAAGGFILLLASGASLLRAGQGWQLDFIRPAMIGLVELAVLVARTDLGLSAWLLFALLSAASFLLATRRLEYRPVPAVALGLALLLLFLKSDIGPALLPIAAAVTLIFAGGAIPLALRRPERLLWTAIASLAFAAPALILRLMQGTLFAPAAWGLLLLLLSAGPLLLAWLIRDRGPAIRVAASAALILAAIAATDLLPRDWVGPVWLALALVAAASGRRVETRLDPVALAAAVAAGIWILLRMPQLWTSLAGSLGGIPALASRLPGAGTALLNLALPAPLLAGLWWLIPSDRRNARALLLAAAGGCATLFLYILFKQAWGLRDQADFVARGFAERLIVTQALFAAGWAVCRLSIPGLTPQERRKAGIILTAFAAARLVWFDMLIDNPVLVAQSVGTLPAVSLLLPAYLLSAFWLYSARRGADNRARSGIWLSLFLLALVFGVMLIVRQGFHGAILTAPGVMAEESYGYSLAALILSLGLLISGVRLPDKALRIAGLALLTATTFKVFLVDASALEGLLRILSFLALGVALIGIGKLYTKVLEAERSTAAPADG